MYCTIITNGYGLPHRFHATQEQGLVSAKGLNRRNGCAVEVSWCRDGVPKVWVAYVATDGKVTRTGAWI